jgi:hypothetical protein
MAVSSLDEDVCIVCGEIYYRGISYGNPCPDCEEKEVDSKNKQSNGGRSNGRIQSK